MRGKGESVMLLRRLARARTRGFHKSTNLAAVVAATFFHLEVRAAGPDLVVCHISGISGHGSLNDVAAFSFGTTATNVGTVPAKWIAETAQHPIIGQNVFRLANGRFEQLGQAWVKHGFSSTNQDLCGNCEDPEDGSLLGVGCSDSYSGTLNGTASNLGPKSEINAFTGMFPYPFGGPPLAGNVLERRVQLRHQDINPPLNVGARYIVEVHYVTRDDALAGNGLNNASWREVSFGPGGSVPFSGTLLGATETRKSGVFAWQEFDSAVDITEFRVSNEGLFLVGAKATALGGGFWHYEFAVQNLNSDRSGLSFIVPVHSSSLVQNNGFKSVGYHSGETYSSSPWQFSRNSTSVMWTTQTFNTNANANALRWGTLYNFWLDVNAAPSDFSTITMGLFKPGQPDAVSAMMRGPNSCGGVTVETACGDDADNDCDGLVDCFDIDCAGDALNCPTGQVPALSDVAMMVMVAALFGAGAMIIQKRNASARC